MIKLRDKKYSVQFSLVAQSCLILEEGRPLTQQPFRISLDLGSILLLGTDNRKPLVSLYSGQEGKAMTGGTDG